MTDPFSIVVGATGLVGAALRTAEVTRDFISEIKGAPQAVKALSDDVTSLREVLNILKELMSSRDCPRNAALVQFIPNLKLPLDHCLKTLDDVDRELRP